MSKYDAPLLALVPGDITVASVFCGNNLLSVREEQIEAYVWSLCYMGEVSVETAEEHFVCKVKDVPANLCSLHSNFLFRLWVLILSLPILT